MYKKIIEINRLFINQNFILNQNEITPTQYILAYSSPINISDKFTITINSRPLHPLDPFKSIHSIQLTIPLSQNYSYKTKISSLDKLYEYLEFHIKNFHIKNY